MAEVSFPFSAPNANGGTAAVSETQWQSMAAMWGGDRVDYKLGNNIYDQTTLPFNATIVNGRTVQINPGNAWVGGFYYQQTGVLSLTIAGNSNSKPRLDLIVIRVDMNKHAANMAVVQGTPASSPLPPTPRRQPGGIWEMAIYEVQVSANNGAITIQGRMPYNMPAPRSFPWYVEEGAKLLEPGSFVYDLDNNKTASQTEEFNGRDGYVITRHLGKSLTYTPSMINCTNAGLTRTGRWRWIAPNTVYFSARIENPSSIDIKASGSSWLIGLTLPVAASGATGQVVSGFIDNNGSTHSTALPNFVSVTGVTPKGSGNRNLYLYRPSASTPSQGLDGLAVIPRKGYLAISGTYEANIF